ncbi:MarR family transcriptional regulator [Kribbella sandramycini]|uniref:MarR family transcriptional regulator n=1 Tax=Kribbella sandramycini TaxID=60450 RepID=A0A7Y4P2D2_9ACTN|nr:MarR family transcriptional regulator [Kribbella sandramycini]MBB6566328.1 DNA-binding MarR family transcriptional regulator [Kribbella sandramycini]NOL43010.1 MarR family transcriptional regulator [Kribbella sandramycini]
MTDDRPDLAAMLYPLMRVLIAAETPILAAHDVSMWGYAVLTALDETPVRTQAALAAAIGADKSRIIGTLDELQAAELIERTPDPDDRRVRLLSITAKGRRVRRAVRKGIRAYEDELLSSVPAADRAGFLRSLRALSGR